MGAARRRRGSAPELSRQPNTPDLALVRQLYDLGDIADGAERRRIYRLATELRQAASAVPVPAELPQLRTAARSALGVLL